MYGLSGSFSNPMLSQGCWQEKGRQQCEERWATRGGSSRGRKKPCPPQRGNGVLDCCRTYIAHGVFKRAALGGRDDQHASEQLLAFCRPGREAGLRPGSGVCVWMTDPPSPLLLSFSVCQSSRATLTCRHVKGNAVLAHEDALAELLEVCAVKGQRAADKGEEDDAQAPHVHLWALVLAALVRRRERKEKGGGGGGGRRRKGKKERKRKEKQETRKNER